ncbi:MAG TPA: hypothetical protein VHB21_24740, partial [Minicystis sp.]|nr:hypothetical protein [Minicystis sp.]
VDRARAALGRDAAICADPDATHAGVLTAHADDVLAFVRARAQGRTPELTCDGPPTGPIASARCPED